MNKSKYKRDVLRGFYPKKNVDNVQLECYSNNIAFLSVLVFDLISFIFIYIYKGRTLLYIKQEKATLDRKYSRIFFNK